MNAVINEKFLQKGHGYPARIDFSLPAVESRLVSTPAYRITIIPCGNSC